MVKFCLIAWRQSQTLSPGGINLFAVVRIMDQFIYHLGPEQHAPTDAGVIFIFKHRAVWKQTVVSLLVYHKTSNFREEQFKLFNTGFVELSGEQHSLWVAICAWQSTFREQKLHEWFGCSWWCCSSLVFWQRRCQLRFSCSLSKSTLRNQRTFLLFCELCVFISSETSNVQRFFSSK